MRVHHLNGATMRPRPAGLVFGDAPPEHRRLVCHCLVVETGAGLAVVDTGLGLEDVTALNERHGKRFRWIVRPDCDPEETIVRQVVRLGYTPKDVRHIVLTHLDVDHAGGLPDFPWAEVHVLDAERDAAMARATRIERERYRPIHWAHEVRWQTYGTAGEPWFGFECVRGLRGLPPEILLVPLLGHTRGHCGVAVERADGWLFHAGDAYFFRDEMNTPPRGTPGLSLFQRVVQVDGEARVSNQARLRELVRTQPDVRVFSAHDSIELGRF